MLRILTNLNLLNRFDVDATAALLAAGVTGTWVSKEGDEIDLPTVSGAHVMVVWTESNRDGTVGFTPDVTATGKLTVLQGPFRALTDQYSGTPAVGNPLVALPTDGKLGVDLTPGDSYVVGYCTKAAHSIEHLGSSHTVIEVMTV